LHAVGVRATRECLSDALGFEGIDRHGSCFDQATLREQPW
jgi:hypothetical protein